MNIKFGNKKRKGFSSIEILASLFVILALVSIVMSNLIIPVSQYIKISEVARKYSLKIEKDGYLTPVNLQNMKNDLVDKGFDLTDIYIDPSTTLTKVAYNSDVTLLLKYSYKYKDITMNGIVPTITNRNFDIKVSESTVFKGE